MNIKTALILLFLPLLTVMIPALVYSETPPTNDKMVCAKSEDINKQLHARGFNSLISMTNQEGVTQYIWVKPDAVVVTAKTNNNDTTCLIAMLKSPVFNDKTIEKVYKSLDSQKGQGI